MLGKVANKYIFISLSFFLMVIGLGLRANSTHNYWSLEVPNSLEPYVERGVIKEVYTVVPNPRKENTRRLGVGIFLSGWIVLCLHLLVQVLTSPDDEDVKPEVQQQASSNGGNGKKGDKQGPIDPITKNIGEIKDFIATHHVLILLSNNLPLSTLSSISHLYGGVLKKQGFQIVLGEVSRVSDGKLSINQDVYIGQSGERVKDRIYQVCTEVSRFKEERGARTGKGNKECLVLSDVDRIVTLSERQSTALISDLIAISSMGLQGFDMRLLLLFSNKTDYMDSIQRMGGTELGLIEINNTSKSHIILKAKGKDDKTIALPSKEAVVKYLSS